MRWFAVCFVFIVSAGVLHPQPESITEAIFSFGLVLAYALATIAMELQPARLLTLFGARDLTPGGAKALQGDASTGDRHRH